VIGHDHSTRTDRCPLLAFEVGDTGRSTSIRHHYEGPHGSCTETDRSRAKPLTSWHLASRVQARQCDLVCLAAATCAHYLKKP
jgi:hypothetical protein